MWIFEIESFKFPMMVPMRDPNHDLFLRLKNKIHELIYVFLIIQKHAGIGLHKDPEMILECIALNYTLPNSLIGNEKQH